MTRIAFAIAIAIVVGLAAPAWAADATPQPCPPVIVAELRAQLPKATAVVCFPDGHDSHAEPAAAADAHATPEPRRVQLALSDGRTAVAQVLPDGKLVSLVYNHGDINSSPGKGMAILFWLFAAAAVGGALFVVTRRNLIAAVMGMVGSFIGIAAVYMLLYAQFLAVVQMLVYAGAIMVLFVFVVMILNRPEDEPVAPSGRAGQVLGGLAILYLIGRLIMLLVNVKPANLEVALAAPATTAEGHDWGSVAAVGTDLFGPGLFPFEAISILLLLAVVGAIAIARPLHSDDDAPARTRAEGAP